MAAAQVVHHPVVNQALLQVVSQGDPRITVIVSQSMDRMIDPAPGEDAPPRVVDSEASVSGWISDHLQRGDVILVEAPLTFLPLDPSHHPATVRIAERITDLGVRVFGATPPHGSVTQIDARLHYLRATQQQIATQCFYLPPEDRVDLIARWKQLEAEWNQLYNDRAWIQGTVARMAGEAIARFQGRLAADDNEWLVAHANALHLFASQGRVFSNIVADENEMERIYQFFRQNNITVMVPVGDFTDDPLIRFEKSFDAEIADELEADEDNNQAAI